MDVDITLSKCCLCNIPWGFRLTGGVDFPYPLTVMRVGIDSYADKAGLKVGDVLVRINGQRLDRLTHVEAYHKIKNAGSNMVLCVNRQCHSSCL